MCRLRNTRFFYRQLGCLAFSLRFWQKIKQFLATAQPQIGLFLSKQVINRVKINYKTKQRLSNFQARFPKFRQQLQAQMENRVVYKKCVVRLLNGFSMTPVLRVGINDESRKSVQSCWRRGIPNGSVFIPPTLITDYCFFVVVYIFTYNVE